MLRGFVIIAVCIVTLVAVDQQVYGGQYTDQTVQMLRQIGYSFGF